MSSKQNPEKVSGYMRAKETKELLKSVANDLHSLHIIEEKSIAELLRKSGSPENDNEDSEEAST